MLIVVAGASWFAGRQAAEPTWQATMSLKLDMPDQAPASPAKLTEMYSTLVADEMIAAEAINQMSQRGHRFFNDPADYQAIVGQRLTVQGRDGGVIALVCRDTNPDTALAIVESTGRALMGYQM